MVPSTVTHILLLCRAAHLLGYPTIWKQGRPEIALASSLRLRVVDPLLT
jgi:hypothetical protein